MSDNTINGQKLEFGNKEQIEFLKKAQTWQDALLNGEAELSHETVKCRVTLLVKFPCINCASELEFEGKGHDHEILESLIENEETTCWKCGTTYVFEDDIIKCIENTRDPEKTND